MRVVVTGGAGFVGSHVVDRLVRGGHDIAVIDALSPTAHAEAPDYLCERAEYHWIDVADLARVRAIVDGADAVCHQAARVGLGRDFRDIDAYVADNDLGTACLLRALHETEFDGRLVLASSMVVYGEGRYRCGVDGIVVPAPRTADAIAGGSFEPPCPFCGLEVEPEPVPEAAPMSPRSVYAATKLHQEHLCALFGGTHGVPVTALRYHNIYGPRMPIDTPYAGVASIFLSALAGGRAPQVLEDGRQLRDFIHVADVARANVLALTRSTPYDGALNIASGYPRTVGDLAHQLWLAAGASTPSPMIVGGSRPGDVRHVFASTDAASEHLDFAASVPFEDGVKQLVSAPMRRTAISRAAAGKR
jgi:dTDP-L-rhamnose 4-epimerase